MIYEHEPIKTHGISMKDTELFNQLREYFEINDVVPIIKTSAWFVTYQ